MSHTPTPWKAEENRVFQIKHPTFRIAICTSNSADYLEEKANAEFIVRACNNHDELLEALKESQIALYDAMHAGHLSRSYGGKVMDKIEQAIAKVEGK